VYIVLILLLYFIVLNSPLATNHTLVVVLILATIFLMFRYATTRYTIDDSMLRARRILGAGRMPLSDIRKIEYMSLRDLSPTGFFGSWGYRGRMWSPYIGAFNAVYTDPVGVLITGGPYPLFISPRNREEFVRELSRRVRSYSGPLSVDVGFPEGGF
jgi:hypothetical protein